jgi:hypothetical protein
MAKPCGGDKVIDGGAGETSQAETTVDKHRASVKTANNIPKFFIFLISLSF